MKGSRGPDGSRQALAWLAHPVTVVALVVLLVNDHLLKQVWPGLVTGKLSDVAGLVLAPPLLASLAGVVARRAPASPVAVTAIIVAGAGFAVVKALPAGARIASGVWSVLNGPSMVRADPTDLLALPALGIAWYAWTRVRYRPAPRAVASAVRLAVLLPIALAGVVATSAPLRSPLPIASGVGPDGEGGAVILVDEYRVTTTSPDGVHWSDFEAKTPDPASPCLGERDDWMACPNDDLGTLFAARVPHPRLCTVDGQTCYRVVPGHLRLEESTDAGRTWTTAWEIGDRQRDRYATLLGEQLSDAAYVLPKEIDDIREGLTCTNVYLVPGSGVVLAACGLVGFVSRDATGVWTMIGFNGDPSSAPSVQRTTRGDVANGVLVVALGWLILMLAAEAHARTHPNGPTRQRRWLVAMVCVAGLAAPLLFRAGGIGAALLAVACVLGGATCALSWPAFYLHDRSSFPWWLLPIAVGVAVADVGLVNAVIHAEVSWTAGWAAIWALTITGMIVNITLGALLPRRRLPVQPSTLDGR